MSNELTPHVLAKPNIDEMYPQYKLDMLATTLWCLIWTADFGTKLSLILNVDSKVSLCIDVEVTLPQADGVHVKVSHVHMCRHADVYNVDRKPDWQTKDVKDGLETFIKRAYAREAILWEQPKSQASSELDDILVRLDRIEKRLNMEGLL